MKRLLFFFTLFIPLWLLAQPFSIQGYITDATTGAPIANHSVSINSTTPTFPYSNTVLTNMAGFYSDAINVPSTVPQVAFIVTTNDCNGNTLTYTVVYFVNAPNPAVADFQICGGSTTGCQAYFTYGGTGASVNFQNQSQGGSTYFWDFGNGQTSNVMHPNVTYSQPGTYSVCLTVSDSLTGCIDTYCDTLTITGSGSCQAAFVVTTSGNIATFSNTSTGVNNTTNYLWDFGDGTTSTAINPTHTYTNTSTTVYYVCLYINTQTATGVCTDTTCQYLTILSSGGCQAYFTYAVNGGTVSFQNQSTPSGYFSNWNFGNGQTSSVQHPNQTYTQTGWYYVCLIIYDSTGCQSNYCDSIYVNVGTTPSCQAAFVPTISGNTVSFSNTSTGGTPNTMTYSWVFGNGNTSNAFNPPTQPYNVPGNYTVCLYILNTQNGCTDTTCQVITIPNSSGNCSANFGYQLLGTTGSVAFSGIATGGTAPYTYTWSFGDGTNAVGPNPTHTYLQSGIYTVCLMIVDMAGCSATYCDTLNMTVLAINNGFVSHISALYPNPTQSETSFDIALTEKANMQVEILNTIGQSIAVQNTSLTSGSHTLSISTKNLPQGMYFVKIAAEGQLIATKRLIKE